MNYNQSVFAWVAVCAVGSGFNFGLMLIPTNTVAVLNCICGAITFGYGLATCLMFK